MKDRRAARGRERRKRLPEDDHLSETHAVERWSTGIPLAAEDMLLFHGAWYPLRHGPNCQLPGFAGDGVQYSSPLALRRALQNQLHDELQETASYFATRIGTGFRRIVIRTQRTRWGSCSPKGELSFNLAMAALPDHLRRYIVLHEVVHLVERDHSTRFWRRVESFRPECRNDRRELREYWALIWRNRVWQVLRTIRDD